MDAYGKCCGLDGEVLWITADIPQSVDYYACMQQHACLATLRPERDLKNAR